MDGSEVGEAARNPQGTFLPPTVLGLGGGQAASLLGLGNVSSRSRRKLQSHPSQSGGADTSAKAQAQAQAQGWGLCGGPRGEKWLLPNLWVWTTSLCWISSSTDFPSLRLVSSPENEGFVGLGAKGCF